MPMTAGFGFCFAACARDHHKRATYQEKDGNRRKNETNPELGGESDCDEFYFEQKDVLHVGEHTKNMSIGQEAVLKKRDYDQFRIANDPSMARISILFNSFRALCFLKSVLSLNLKRNSVESTSTCERSIRPHWIVCFTIIV